MPPVVCWAYGHFMLCNVKHSLWCVFRSSKGLMLWSEQIQATDRRVLRQEKSCVNTTNLVLVFSHFCNKTLQSKCLKQQKWIVSGFEGRRHGIHQAVSSVGFFLRKSIRESLLHGSFLASGGLLVTCAVFQPCVSLPHRDFFMCAFGYLNPIWPFYKD